ncbi:unnamed protein product [Lathyrus sativus]|nr:unnamed protein product [Lathyrus sativus]CAK8081279.1 unnamed protein product [Lathyrus sativus]
MKRSTYPHHQHNLEFLLCLNRPFFLPDQLQCIKTSEVLGLKMEEAGLLLCCSVDCRFQQENYAGLFFVVVSSFGFIRVNAVFSFRVTWLLRTRLPNEV